MTVTITTNRINYEGDGTVGPYAIPFPYGSTAELVILRRDADYNVTELSIGDGIDSIGVSGVTLTTALESDERLNISRQFAPTQELDLTPHDRFSAEDIEDSLDKLTRACISNFREIELLKRLAIQVPYFSEIRDIITVKDVVPNGFLALNTACTEIEFISPDEVGGLTEDQVEEIVDTANAILASDVVTALTEGVWHSAVGWTRSSVNGAGDVDEEELTSFTIPANLMGANDALEIITSWTFVGADNKNIPCYFGTTKIHDPNLTTSTSQNVHLLVSNRNSTASQYAYNTLVGTSFAGHTSGSAATGTEDCTEDVTVSFKCSWDAAADSHSITLERYLARLVRP